MTRPKIMIIPVTPFQQNCSLLWNDDTHIGAVVDPGGDVDVIMQAIEKSKVTVEKILLTHGHIDHAGGAAELRDRLKVRIEGPHTEDAFLLAGLPKSGAQYGYEARAFTPDRWLKEGDKVTVGALEFDILECPGHTPGSVVLFNGAHRFCFMGDVLFQGSVGRTDFPYGSHETLIASIRDKLLPLGDDVAFLPGHGPASSIGEERRSNPFLSELS
ncbi:MBL fold metallo-hydrolase [Taklimakanibacter lacteus]|uniref:MBL fold metallo-hydrolase n=1 Tax=Taklimakanibacter lacteus TaxID=2268456 RepID=UPI000E67125D